MTDSKKTAKSKDSKKSKKLKLNKETLRDLSPGGKAGGVRAGAGQKDTCGQCGYCSYEHTGCIN